MLRSADAGLSAERSWCDRPHTNRGTPALEATGNQVPPDRSLAYWAGFAPPRNPETTEDF
ncbi:hypothetical protein CSUI_000284 [Cystoisospora suis]|uniref:Uncharacterized protein n=1 Tax=Cystoisospora suis TaxID=483139 RepID=A0A2C6L1L2_9APIC|nr:hypothetical protein CSUI_000284 [Cystoisospora suis]